MAKQPLRSYKNQMMNYGIGKMFAENKPVTRGMMAEAELPEDPTTYLDNLKRLKMVGGLSGINQPVRNRLFDPLPKDIAEATKQVVQAGDTDSIFELGTPSDFVPFVIPEGANVIVGKSEKPGTITQSKGELGSKVIPNQLEGGRGDVVEKPGERAGYFAQLAADKAISNKMDKDNAIEDAFKAGLDEYIKSARGAGPADREMTIDDYKKEFADATGIDISGKVDKSQALMAFGLALMQNRAGKGFNVGRMLSAVGQAGEAALPELEKAKESARANVIAAGKYALQTRSSDRATDAANKEKAMQRGKYWVYKKGEKGSEFANFDDGEFVDLNAYELDQLIKNKDFEDQYEFIDASDRMAILEKRAEGVDLGDMWGSYDRISLIGGKADDVPPELQVLAAPVDSNYKGTAPTAFKLAEKPETVARRFVEMQTSINSGAKKFEELLSNLEQGVTIPDQFLSKANELFVAFGFGETDSVTEAKRQLQNIAIDRATEILKESGKTLSDNDRKLVIQRIGEISWGSADINIIRQQLRDIYDLTILKPQRNLDRAMSWLEQNAGISFAPVQDDMPTQAELDAMNKENGTNLTMDDFKKGS